MKVSGKIEVFRNDNNYYTGILKAWEDNKVIGKLFIDVKLPFEIARGQTWTLFVKEGYLNVRYGHTKEGGTIFTRPEIQVVDCDVIKKYIKDSGDEINDEGEVLFE